MNQGAGNPGKLRALARDVDVLRGILEASRDACWCIEYEEPVDLTAPEAEVLRQFFENVSFWRLCNEAMARLYKLPAGLDFNEQSVRFHFSRSPANEEFVRQLMAADFNLDNAPSVDTRHDGTTMHAENDVRADIREGRLHRMWGLVRDVSAFKRTEQALTRRVDAMLDVLSAVPDPILVIGGDGLLEAANPALTQALGWGIDALLGTAIDDLCHVEDGFVSLARRMRPGQPGHLVDLEVDDVHGGRHRAQMHLAAMEAGSGEHRWVATLRLQPGSPRAVAS
ncbi:MAG: PAS domain-containing protein [Proteobacteria bacterium]|nr:PAS domain-containing protein [Pseudomonadota bacterium]